MARSTVTATQINRTAIAVAGSAANVDGHAIAWREGLFLYVNNGGGSAITVTVPTPGTVDGLAIADWSASVPAGANRVFGGFSADHYRQSDGTIHINFSGVTSVTFGAFYV